MGGVSSTGCFDDLSAQEAPFLHKPSPVFARGSFKARRAEQNNPASPPNDTQAQKAARKASSRSSASSKFKPNPFRRTSPQHAETKPHRLALVDTSTQTDSLETSPAQYQPQGESTMAVQQKGAMIQHAPFGDLIPWGDPAWYRGEYTPYYTPSHVQWRARVREFVEREITPNAHQ
eukprot:scaffold349467_cov43-Prasinocladus_malaysianus.AAC.1